MSAYDPRAVANAILDEADRHGIGVSNLVLQKLLYLAHSLHLVEQGQPLVTGYFEAWQYGPVHPGAYESFKAFGPAYIDSRAESVDPVSMKRRAIPTIQSAEATRIIARVVAQFGHISPGRLVDVMHAKNAPWDHVLQLAKASAQIGLRIPDEVIRERFRFHKIAVGPSTNSGEPNEDSPFA